MDSVRSFLMTLFAWMLFAVSGFSFLSNELSAPVSTVQPKEDKVMPWRYEGLPDLSLISGEQALSLVSYALAGDFKLQVETSTGYITVEAVTGLSNVDFFKTNERATEISKIDLSVIPGQSYKMSVYRDKGTITMIQLKRP
ncbi:hypothetical protein [Paenibacillus turpanensis]|uniref:hypothetical protein n=1 Tax=Paenibacillus turpanensis TaxID=2689078 RepID=UPI00140E2B7C|nr:hypothetical protein [Paenibacillus turpanensis]